ncbi:hypothetical protein FHX42_002338 [Saccharopolyspora lacisalsi]|uniref:DUF1702 family protein n=1 Tax=Halosaccharopolyspora lacisalsi TaxID=1000566 RepID=A0A839E0M0_9PSEU|nr:DUF1702 family protein [Halosaccharopolyspora lacisalsi]MBA8824991.1 hypothetical protein [Halosaccharopolyspora lacisalsi]
MFDAVGKMPSTGNPISLLRQNYDQVDFGVRRFRLRPGPARQRLESAARAFVDGVNAVVDLTDVDAVTDRVEQLEPQWRGFAYEGAGMGCAVLDLMTFSRGRRCAALLERVGTAYPHVVHIGVGWAHARLRLRPWWGIPVGDPLLRWLGWDGFGFHQGFFHSDAVIGRHRVERGLAPEQRAIRDQGLGRALWFHECADPDGITPRIEHFPQHRRADLWSGVGLAATYAGGADGGELGRLTVLAGRHTAAVAQGSAFACAARRACGIVPEHVEQAAAALTGASASEAAAWTDRARDALGDGPHGAAHYEKWRAEIRRLWSDHHRAGHGEPFGNISLDQEETSR